MKKPYLSWQNDSFGHSNPKKNSDEKNLEMSEEDKRCMRLVPFVVDNEAEPDDLKLFEQRINHCTKLADYYQLEKALKQALQSKIERISVPDDLINSIKLKIRETA